MLQCTDNKKQPAINIIDGNVHVLSHIPDEFQGVAEIVSDGLPKPSKVNIVTKENYKVLWTQQTTIDLRPEDLSTKGLERLHGKSSLQCYSFLSDILVKNELCVRFERGSNVLFTGEGFICLSPPSKLKIAVLFCSIYKKTISFSAIVF